MVALILGAGLGYAINLNLPLLTDVTISCIFLILLSRLRNRLKTPAQWWGSIGLCSGSFLGTASSMVHEMQRASEAAQLRASEQAHQRSSEPSAAIDPRIPIADVTTGPALKDLWVNSR